MYLHIDSSTKVRWAGTCLSYHDPETDTWCRLSQSVGINHANGLGPTVCLQFHAVVLPASGQGFLFIALRHTSSTDHHPPEAAPWACLSGDGKGEPVDRARAEREVVDGQTCLFSDICSRAERPEYRSQNAGLLQST